RNSPEETAAILDASRAAGVTCPSAANDCPRYQAADPTLRVLEVMRGGTRAGLMVFFAIHPTAMTHDCTLYQSDLAGSAMTTLETVPKDAAPVVAGFFNGAEGDVSPRWVSQDRRDVETFGRGLAGAVTTLLKQTAAPETAPA